MKINFKKVLLTLSITALMGILSMNAGMLHDAVDAGDLEKVKSVVENNNNIDINETGITGHTALLWAAYRNYHSIVKYLVEHGSDINKTNTDGFTPLCMAITGNSLEIVEYLVKLGADTNKTNNRGITPLYMAAKYNNLKMVKCLVEHGADINKAAHFDFTPLCMASCRNNFEMVKYLVKHGADITLKNVNNETAFEATSHQGIKEYLAHVKNYFDNKTIVTLQSTNQNNQLINPLVIPDYLPLAIKINHLYDINAFAQVPQFDDDQYLLNLRHYIKTMQLKDKCDDGLVTALWLHYKQNPKAEIIKTKTGLKFLTQKNLLTKIEDTKNHFADIIVKTQK